jgi:hypothetical protein
MVTDIEMRLTDLERQSDEDDKRITALEALVKQFALREHKHNIVPMMDFGGKVK